MILRKLTLLAILLGIASGIAACDDTIRGFGEDTEQVGDEVEDATN
jgi:predicted small secreted protein